MWVRTGNGRKDTRNTEVNETADKIIEVQMESGEIWHLGESIAKDVYSSLLMFPRLWKFASFI